MFLHIGGETVVPLAEIIAITEYRDVKSAVNREYISTVRGEHLVKDVSEGRPKSFIITDHHVYFSPISATTLRKRAETVYADRTDD